MAGSVLPCLKSFGFLIEVTDVQICTTNNLFSKSMNAYMIASRGIFNKMEEDI